MLVWNSSMPAVESWNSGRLASALTARSRDSRLVSALTTRPSSRKCPCECPAATTAWPPTATRFPGDVKSPRHQKLFLGRQDNLLLRVENANHINTARPDLVVGNVFPDVQYSDGSESAAQLPSKVWGINQ